MASAKTPLEQHVDAIKLLLRQNQVEVIVGELGQHHWGGPRRVLFEPHTGTLEQPKKTGAIEVEAGRWGRPFRGIPLRVTAHIVAESHTACWVLWQNVCVASWKSLKGNSTELDFNLNPPEKAMVSGLADTARYVMQDFRWNFTMFDRVTDLPDYTADVTELTKLGDMYPMDDFGNAQEFSTDPNDFPSRGSDLEEDE